jgi:hypothetical protein
MILHNKEESVKYQNEGVFFLGFSEKTDGLSESVTYLRHIIATFIKKLSINPDIEILRKKTIVDIEKDEINDLLDSAPYLTGSEHLNGEWIEKLWQTLNNSFSEMIESYNGSISEFFFSFSPNINLIGRVFFHLVESKKDDYPFAFLATYSVNDVKSGTSNHFH